MARISNKNALGIVAVVAVCLATLASAPAAKATVYNVVDPNFPGATVTGTITTDGVLGVLAASDITAFSVQISDGAFNPLIFSSDTYADENVVTSALTATATGLYFDFSGLGYFFMASGASGGVSGNYSFLAYVGTDGNCNGISGAEICASNVPAANPTLSSFRRGSVLIASVPEPLTLSLFGAGLAGAVAMRRRKKTA